MKRDEFNAESESPAVRSLDGVRLSAAKRSQAKASMRQAEAAVDLIVAMVRATLAALDKWKNHLMPTAARERDAYLSRAVDRVDLEHRIRALERRPTAFLDGI